ncbi:hypothetical protein CRG98_036456 [Punica granatum]|uniref:Integrase catalytic domain-containing protein n=1 Tax=Punica granatum TaxID=22663 RepID=A0A2I0IHH6_PUNGR|nr:hypothetical protein CRG98_036456 [Punica granatum]
MPQQNGRVKRRHRRIFDVARALLFQASMPLEFWGDCVLTAAHLINRTPSTVLSGKTPYEILFRKFPQFDHLKERSGLHFLSEPDPGDAVGQGESRPSPSSQGESNSVSPQFDQIPPPASDPTALSPGRSAVPEASGTDRFQPDLRTLLMCPKFPDHILLVAMTRPPLSTSTHRPLQVKHKADGSVERFKACLVAKGFTQIEGVDFTKTFALVAKFVTIRCLLTVFVARSWELN